MGKSNTEVAMAGRLRSRGRPWASVDHLDAETLALVSFLRGLIDATEGGLRGLSKRLTAEHYGAVPPGYTTLSARLKGQGLARDGALAAAIVRVCAPPDRKEELLEEVTRLLHRARHQTKDTNDARSARIPEVERELIAAQRRIIALQNEVAQVRAAYEKARRQLAETRGQLARQGVEELRPDERDVVGNFPGPRDQGVNEKEGVAAGAAQTLPLEQQVHATSEVHDGDPEAESEDELERVARAVLAADPDGRYAARALRVAIDEVLDGQRTGRYDWAELSRSERLYLGAKVETMLQTAWHADGGRDAGFSVAGTDVAMLFSTSGRWVIARESIGRVCLLVVADDARSSWSAGLVHITDELLSVGSNRDGKRALTNLGRRSIRWIFEDTRLPENVLLHLPRAVVDEVLSHRVGQLRVNALFRSVREAPISRTALATVSMQSDWMKRVREARRMLRSEGIAIIGAYADDLQIARALHLPAPEPGHWLSVKLTPWRPEHGEAPAIVYGGKTWTLATEDDDPVEPLG
jgi:hypothetical protein